MMICAAAVVVAAGQQVRAAVAVRLDLSALAVRSDSIAVARLEKAGPSWWEKGRIFTRYTFRVERCIAGDCSETLEIVQPGGRVGRLMQKVSGYPVFHRGEAVLLFLERWKRGVRTVGLSQGVFERIEDGGRVVWRQRLEDISFAGNDARPLELETEGLELRLRSLWRRKAVER